MLCDPLISTGTDHSDSRYTYADLPEKIDYVILSQAFRDRCVLETLLRLRHKIGTVIVPRSVGGSLADPSLRLMLRQLGFSDVRELDEMEKLEIRDGSITGLPHLGGHADLNIRGKLAYAVKLGGKSIVCAADANVPEPKLFDAIRAGIGKLDVLFVEMGDSTPMSWKYGPLLTKPISRAMDHTRRSNVSSGTPPRDDDRPFKTQTGLYLWNGTRTLVSSFRDSLNTTRNRQRSLKQISW